MYRNHTSFFNRNRALCHNDSLSWEVSPLGQVNGKYKLKVQFSTDVQLDLSLSSLPLFISNPSVLKSGAVLLLNVIFVC